MVPVFLVLAFVLGVLFATGIVLVALGHVSVIPRTEERAIAWGLTAIVATTLCIVWIVAAFT